MIKSFVNSGKLTLFNQGPIIGNPRYRKSNFDILLKEIFYRTAFLIINSSKFLYQTASISSIYQSPSAYWVNFSKNARHLAADLFEEIGVIVFSIFSLPFRHTDHNICIKAQLFIENTADKISGESDFIKKKIKLFEIAENLASLDEEDKINWRANQIALDNWIHTRRISRNISQTISEKLNKLENLFNAKIKETAIKKQEKNLNNLNTLIKNLNLTYPLKEDFNRQSNSYFEDLTTAIEKKQSFIRKSIDPENKMEKSLDSFNLLLKNQCLEEFEKFFGYLFLRPEYKLRSYDIDFERISFNFCHIEHFMKSYKSFFDQKALFRFESKIDIDIDNEKTYVEKFLEKNSESVTLLKSKSSSATNFPQGKFIKDVFIMMLNLPADTDGETGKDAFEKFDFSSYVPKTSSQIYYSTFEQIYKILKSREVSTVDVDID
jgi:hypothetical protein